MQGEGHKSHGSCGCLCSGHRVLVNTSRPWEALSLPASCPWAWMNSVWVLYQLAINAYQKLPRANCLFVSGDLVYSKYVQLNGVGWCPSCSVPERKKWTHVIVLIFNFIFGRYSISGLNGLTYLDVQFIIIPTMFFKNNYPYSTCHSLSEPHCGYRVIPNEQVSGADGISSLFLQTLLQKCARVLICTGYQCMQSEFEWFTGKLFICIVLIQCNGCIIWWLNMQGE